MVEYTVPDELTVFIPPRMGLVLIVHTCTHSVENQAPLPKNKDFKAQLIDNYTPITLGEKPAGWMSFSSSVICAVCDGKADW